MTPADRLLAIAREKAHWFSSDELSSPDFSEESRYTGWAYYVPAGVSAVWSELGIESRLVAAIAALELRERDNPRF